MRQAGPEDEAFLYALFAEERAAQLAGTILQDAEMQALIEMQFRGRELSYAARFPLAENSILLDREGAPAGRLLLDRQAPDRWRLVDIGVLAAQRGKGLATRALRRRQRQCTAAGVGLELQVTPWNPARGLYQRLGFVTVCEDEMAVEMLWLPANDEAGNE
jgi:ribosomal protein S18 acetylase RimI-like enzyme